MTRRSWPWVLIFCLISSFAFAQDKAEKDKPTKEKVAKEKSGDDAGMSFGEDEVETATTATPVQKYMEEGKKLYKSGKYDEAGLLFFKVLEEKDISAEPFWPEGEYELGKTLFKMGLYQGALSYFSKIVEKGESHPYFLATLNGLVLLTDVMPEDPVVMEQLAAYNKFFPNDVPKKYRDRYAYLVGRHLYSQLDIEGAIEMLSQVKPGGPDYAKARYISGVTYVSSYEADPAIDAFKDVLRALTAIQGKRTLKKDEQRLLDLANLGMARVFYSVGGKASTANYNKSLKYYAKIKRNTEFWPTALFESSWVFFQVDLFNKALGNLHSINSPFFSDKYFPEGPVLASVIYFYNCKYKRSRNELDEFEYEYEPLITEVDAIVGEYGDNPEGMYDWLKKQSDAPESKIMGQVMGAALNDLQIRNKLKLILSIEDEIAKVGEKAAAWKDSSLGTYLVQESQLAISFAKSDAGALAVERLNRVSRELDDLSLEKEKIMVELAKAERGQIESDLLNEGAVKVNITKAGGVKVSDEELYWSFDGEYWRDEVGYYTFNINSECKR